MNFFDHKDLGNHLLQLFPEVVKHSVYVYIYICFSNYISLRSSPTVTLSKFTVSPAHYRHLISIRRSEPIILHQTYPVLNFLFRARIRKQLPSERLVAVWYNRYMYCQSPSTFPTEEGLPLVLTLQSLFLQHVPTSKYSTRFLFPPSQKHIPRLQLHF